jgi:hypothetical protein
VQGSIVNQSSKDIFSVGIKLTLTDKNGNVLSESVLTARDISVGATKSIEGGDYIYISARYGSRPIYGAKLDLAYANPKHIVHGYEVLVKDINDKPVEGAAVTFTTSDVFVANGSRPPKIECITDEGGLCRADVEASAESVGLLYSSSVKYSAAKDGFYPGGGGLSSSYGSEYSKQTDDLVKGSITIYRPSDYLSEVFQSSAADRALREQALKFISEIRLQSLIVDADVMLRSTGTSIFKGKKYFQMKINTTTTFNSLKLDKYAVGKRIFDESIRKILNPLNTNISNPKTFFGYDLIIYGYTKSFTTEEFDTPEKIEYRFLIPQETVRRYKNKDISGQRLLDASVVLMNDERIDLKLQ